MYVHPDSIDKTILYQGDIISGFPFFIFENSQYVKKNEIGNFEYHRNENNERSLIVLETKKQNVMILSQSCDAQRRKNVIICPVYDLNQFIIDNTLNKDSIDSIRKRKNGYLFYLPELENLSESIADLQTMIHIPRKNIEGYKNQKIISLSDLGRHHLGWCLSSYFGRPSEK